MKSFNSIWSGHLRANYDNAGCSLRIQNTECCCSIEFNVYKDLKMNCQNKLFWNLPWVHFAVSPYPQIMLHCFWSLAKNFWRRRHIPSHRSLFCLENPQSANVHQVNCIKVCHACSLLRNFQWNRTVYKKYTHSVLHCKSFTMSLARSLRNSPYMRLASSKRWRWNLLLMDSDPIRGPNSLRENLQAWRKTTKYQTEVYHLTYILFKSLWFTDLFDLYFWVVEVEQKTD